MSLETELYSLLAGNAGVSALVSARIYPLLAPQGSTLPLIVYQKIASEWHYGVNAVGVLQKATMQIDCWASSYAGAKALFSAVKTAMDGATVFRAILLSDTDLQDPETREFRVSADFSVWYKP